MASTFAAAAMCPCREACALRNFDFTIIAAELEEATRTIHLPNNLQFDKWKVDFLVDYIINVHHAYLLQALPFLQASIVSFMEGHKKKYPELMHINEVFRELSANLLAHNRHEEEIIFPYIKQIEIAYRKKESYGNLFVRTLRKPLSAIENEHHNISRFYKN